MNIRINIVKISAYHIIENIRTYRLPCYANIRNNLNMNLHSLNNLSTVQCENVNGSTPHVEIEDQIFNAQLFWGKHLVMQGHSKFV